LQRQSVSHRAKAEGQTYEYMRACCAEAGFAKVLIDAAWHLHRRACASGKAHRKENRDGFMAASLYMSCQRHLVPRTIQECAAVFRVAVDKATAMLKELKATLRSLDAVCAIAAVAAEAGTTAVNFIDAYCSRLRLSDVATRLCLFVAVAVDARRALSANVPNSVAASVIYYVCHSLRHRSADCAAVTKQRVSEETRVSAMTIGRCAEQLGRLELLPGHVF
jgi:transcription initiation factor TFIIIB Brf1 subunit/transcription initiation factor TFIIB